MRNSWMCYLRVEELEKGSEPIKKKKSRPHKRKKFRGNEEHTDQDGRLSLQPLNKAKGKG